jgi:hypothetical protein
MKGLSHSARLMAALVIFGIFGYASLRPRQMPAE